MLFLSLHGQREPQKKSARKKRSRMDDLRLLPAPTFWAVFHRDPEFRMNMSLSKMELMRLTCLPGLRRSAEKQRPVQRFHIYAAIRKSWFIGRKKEKVAGKPQRGQAAATVPQAPLSASAATLGPAAQAPGADRGSSARPAGQGAQPHERRGQLACWTLGDQAAAHGRQLQRPSGQTETRAPPGAAIGRRLRLPSRELAFSQVSVRSHHQPTFSQRERPSGQSESPRAILPPTRGVWGRGSQP